MRTQFQLQWHGGHFSLAQLNFKQKLYLSIEYTFTLYRTEYAAASRDENKLTSVKNFMHATKIFGENTRALATTENTEKQRLL